MPAAKAVFFDVDFTLIFPGPAFQPEGYARLCAGHGVAVDPARFAAAAAAAAQVLADEAGDLAYDPEVFLEFARRLIRGMGGEGPGIEACAREIYDAWAECGHFQLYEEVPDVLRTLHAAGLRIGLISNTHRCLETFQRHFALDGLIAAAVSSSAHGYMKPHPSIFAAALQQAGVERPADAVMVGDSLVHDIAGALRLGMRGVLVQRGGPREPAPPGVPVIATLRELPPLVGVS
jgi:HAD superfamily hydrolase (TIGR01549 family)